MKSIPVAAIAVTTSLILLAGCATDDPNRRAKTGAVIGAVTGGVIGNQSGSKNGKYVGAVVGALSGAAVGNYMDKQQRRLEQALEKERRDQKISVTRIDKETLRLDVKSEATFKINSVEINPTFRDSLITMTEVISNYDKTAVHVIGHTDSSGSQRYNQTLSEKRASAVADYLGRNGVERSRLRFSGRGETMPIKSNATSAGRSSNRRVEVYLKSVVKGRENDAFSPPV